MYQLSGSDFSELITREFVPGVASRESSGELEGVFNCQANNLRTVDFDLLRFNANFGEQLQVNDFHDTSHVSMHFQFTGYSDATISGINGNKPMRKGKFNVLNCVDPVSTFVFPKQQRYEYVCVGLKPSFFNGILAKCGADYEQLLDRSLSSEGFSLFTDGAAISTAQLEILRLLGAPPVADALRGEYLKSKVSELVLLCLDGCLNSGGNNRPIMSLAEADKFQAVKDYLDIEYLSPLTLEGIARKFLLNEFKLKKGFKEMFGKTVFGHIHEQRMRHAALLLESGGLRVGEVATVVGYTSDSSFVRAFRQFYGCSPGKLR